MASVNSVDCPRLRVLHCIHSTLGGGAERQLRMLHAAFGAIGIESTIFCIDDGGDAAALLTDGVHLSKDAGSHPLRVYREVAAAIRDRRPTVVHAWLPPAITVPAMLAARMARLPVVFSYRNRMWFRDWKRMVEFVAAVVACTGVASNNPPAQSAAQYRWLYRRRDGVVIPNALDLPEDLRGCCRPRAHASFRLLFAGRLTRQKNWRCLIDALSGLTSEHEWELSICGEGEDRALLTAAVNAAGITARVKLKGYCRDLVTEMRDCDLLIAPSWYEGAPNVLMEALYLGLPALVSDIAAHREVLGAAHGSCCFRPDDSAGLRMAVAAILDQPARLAAIRTAQSSIVFMRPLAAAHAYQAYYAKVVGKAALRLTRK